MTEKNIPINDGSLGNLFGKVQRPAVPQPPVPNENNAVQEAQKAAELKRLAVAKTIKQWLALKQFDTARVMDGKVPVANVARLLSSLLESDEIFFAIAPQPANAPKLVESSLMTRVKFPNQQIMDQFIQISSQTGREIPNEPLEKFYYLSCLAADPGLKLEDLKDPQYNDLILRTVMMRQIGLDQHVLINPRIYNVFNQNGITVAMTYTDMTAFPRV